MTPLAETTPIRRSAPAGTTPLFRLRHIVVATDFSVPATCALQDAIALAKQFGSTLTLVHAASPFIYSTGEEVVPYEILEKNLSDIRAQLDGVIHDDPILQSLAPRTVAEYGEPVTMICDIAAAQSADLIVVGSHGASGLERLALGSVAESVLHKTTVPVLIVGPHCRPDSDLMRSILFATDLQTTPRRAAHMAAALAERSHGKLTLLHVAQEKPSISREALAKLHQDAMHAMTMLLPIDFPRDCTVSLKVVDGEIASSIEKLALMEKATLVVLGIRNRFGLEDHSPWSTFAHVVREAHCPVLGVAATAA